MNKQAQGFSVIELLIILVIVGLIGGGGYLVYSRNHGKPAPKSTSQAAPTNAPAGTTQNIEDLTAQEQSAEDTIDTKRVNDDPATAQSADSAAANIGGAYDESSY